MEDRITQKMEAVYEELDKGGRENRAKLMGHLLARKIIQIESVQVNDSDNPEKLISKIYGLSNDGYLFYFNFRDSCWDLVCGPLGEQAQVDQTNA